MKCWILLATRIIFKWILKITSLPKLYYRLTKQRDVTVTQLRKLKKYGWKVLKLNLDIKYFENCLDLNLCPKFLKFKPPNLQVYRNSDDLYRIVLNKKLKLTKKDEKKASLEFTSLKTLVLKKISLIEKLCLLKLLTDKFHKEINESTKIHQQKLFKLWISQRIKVRVL